MKSLLLFGCAIVLLHTTTAQDLPLPPAADPSKCLLPDISSRLDCFPEAGASAEKCIERGCCWAQTDNGRPWCFYPDGFVGYEKVANESSLRRLYRSQFPGDSPLITSTITQYSPTLFGAKIFDPNQDRFVPPYPKLQIPPESISGQKLYKVQRNEDDSLFTVLREGSNKVLFHALNSNLIFAEQFIQLTAVMNGTLYGVGEHRSRLALSEDWTKYVLWNHDVSPRENTNLYGSHPFILSVDDDGQSLGVYLHNSNAMEILIQPGPKVTFRSIGGILDFYLFAGPTPADVISQYNQLIGLPTLPPYWGLGFHLCRWGYGSSDNTRKVWQKMRDAQIPYDTQWNDIDYMQTNNDFTVDPVNFAGLSDLVKDIHAVGMHYVAMLDPGISNSEPNGTYPPYTDALAMDTLVKDAAGNIYVGKVWNPVSTVYPDFTHPRAVEYWTKQLRDFRQKIEYDALWIDMNEPSNFVDGLEGGCPESKFEDPPFVPAVDGGILQTKTLCMTARHAAGQHYDFHNLFAIIEADVTRRAAEDILQKRTFLISRASFAGQGNYSGHWSGDNYSGWSEMEASIQEILTFSMFGVSFMGADICGFGSEATKELCNRWMQLGAFYSFSRNHNSIGNKDQDPTAFDDEFIASSRKVLNIRYTLLPFLYTLLYNAHVNGETVARPLFFEFPADAVARKVDKAFLWGSALYIIPVLTEGAVSVEAYLPASRWYDWYSGKQLTTSGGDVTLDAPFDTIPLLIQGGNILPTQSPAVTTTESRKNPFTFIVAPDSTGNAKGSLFWDDGSSLDTVKTGQFGLLNLNSTANRFTSTVQQWNTADTPVVSSVKVLNVSSASGVAVNNNATSFNLDQTNKVLSIDIPNIPLSQALNIVWTS